MKERVKEEARKEEGVEGGGGGGEGWAEFSRKAGSREMRRRGISVNSQRRCRKGERKER